MNIIYYKFAILRYFR